MKKSRSKALAPLIALAAALVDSQLSAATLTVCASGCQYSTIQGAIDHAANNDVISIEKGRELAAGNHRWQWAGGAGFGSGIPENSTRLSKVVFSGNKARQDSGGMALSGSGTLTNTVFAHNSAGTNGGGFTASPGFRGGGVVAVSGVYVIENTA